MPIDPTLDGEAALPEGFLFRHAETDEIDAVVYLRMAFLSELHAPTVDEKGVDLRGLNTIWIRRAVSERRYWAYVVENDRRIVGGCGLLLIDKPPVTGRPFRVEGLILNVYVVPMYRRRGIARGMMTGLIREAPNLGADRLLLHATPAAEKLYRRIGFIGLEEPELFLDIPRGKESQ